jgi:hypothetical protein
MGNDTPDWGGYYINQSTYPLLDLAEHAARTGSIMAQDRRGSYLWHTSFQYGLGSVDVDGVGLGAAVDLNADVFETGPFSARMTPTNALGGGPGINRFLNYPGAGRFGVATGLHTPYNKMQNFLGVVFSDGAVQYGATVRVDHEARAVAVLAPDGSYTDIDTALPDFSTYTLFYYLKLIVDASSLTYVRTIVGAHEYALDAYPLFPMTPSGIAFIEGYIVATRAAVGTAFTYVDRLVFTQNEP